MRVLKFGQGLDTSNVVARLLGPGFEVIDFDPTVPPIEQVQDAEVLLLRDQPVSAEIIDAAPQLRLLQRFGQHLMGVDVRYAIRKGIYVARVPTIQTGSTHMVAEHTLFLMLAVAKRYKVALSSIENRLTGVPKTFALRNKTLGMIGVGKTGEALVPMARALGMRVIGIKKRVDRALEERLGFAYLGDSASMGKVLAESDFVSIHLPLDSSTNGFFGHLEFAKMKKGSYFINIARGAIVVREALYEALTSGRVAGAALDVFWEEPIDPRDPLLALENVIATPHIAAATYEAQERLAAMVADNIRLVANGQPPRNQILENDAH